MEQAILEGSQFHPYHQIQETMRGCWSIVVWESDETLACTLDDLEIE